MIHVVLKVSEKINQKLIGNATLKKYTWTHKHTWKCAEELWVGTKKKELNLHLMVEKLFSWIHDALFPCRPGGDHVSRYCQDISSKVHIQEGRTSHYMSDSRKFQA